MSYNFSNETPIYLQIVEIIIYDIISGAINPGDKLLSVRDYSSLFKANPNTISKALMILEDKGLIYTERTNGKYVTTDLELIQKEKENIFLTKLENFIKDINKMGYTYDDVFNKLKEGK